MAEAVGAKKVIDPTVTLKSVDAIPTLNMAETVGATEVVDPTVALEAVDADVPPTLSPRVLRNTDRIAGWLLLPAIQLLWTGIARTLFFFDEPHTFFEDGLFARIDPVALDLVLWTLVWTTALLFFSRHRGAQRLCILFYATFGLLNIDALWTAKAVEDLMMSGSSFLDSCIWLFYFLFSKRVKATFVERWPIGSRPAKWPIVVASVFYVLVTRSPPRRRHRSIERLPPETSRCRRRLPWASTLPVGLVPIADSAEHVAAIIAKAQIRDAAGDPRFGERSRQMQATAGLASRWTFWFRTIGVAPNVE